MSGSRPHSVIREWTHVPHVTAYVWCGLGRSRPERCGPGTAHALTGLMTAETYPSLRADHQHSGGRVSGRATAMAVDSCKRLASAPSSSSSVSWSSERLRPPTVSRVLRAGGPAAGAATGRRLAEVTVRSSGASATRLDRMRCGKDASRVPRAPAFNAPRTPCPINSGRIVPLDAIGARNSPICLDLRVRAWRDVWTVCG